MGSAENKIKKDIMAYLRLKGHECWLNNVGSFHGKYKAGKEGLPDIGGWHKGSGLAYLIEVKTEGKKPSPAQLCFIYNLNRAGGIGITAWSAQDIINDGRL